MILHSSKNRSFNCCLQDNKIGRRRNEVSYAFCLKRISTIQHKGYTLSCRTMWYKTPRNNVRGIWSHTLSYNEAIQQPIDIV